MSERNNVLYMYCEKNNNKNNKKIIIIIIIILMKKELRIVETADQIQMEY